MQQEMEALQNLKEIQLSGTDLSQINSFTGSEKYGGISRITKSTTRQFGPHEVDPTNFIAISENEARQQISLMLGEKVIGKVFNDNLNDFDDNQQDMEPIMNICAIITKLLVILKELDVK